MMSSLILIPTELERRKLVGQLMLGEQDDEQRDRTWSVALCGFGLIAAAARTAMLLAQRRPRRVVLIGIAGALDEQVAIGSAAIYRRVICQGIGAGGEEDHLSVDQMGWKHWPGAEGCAAIGDTIELGEPGGEDGATLLSVCAASATAAQAQQRRRRFPHAAAEEMEGFGVALACQLAGVPLWIVRGISNAAGNRDVRRWQIEAALAAAAAEANGLIEQLSKES